jgi:hypothetical protein
VLQKLLDSPNGLWSGCFETTESSESRKASKVIGLIDGFMTSIHFSAFASYVRKLAFVNSPQAVQMLTICLRTRQQLTSNQMS